jgi:hypothetical protein
MRVFLTPAETRSGARLDGFLSLHSLADCAEPATHDVVSSADEADIIIISDLREETISPACETTSSCGVIPTRVSCATAPTVRSASCAGFTHHRLAPLTTADNGPGFTSLLPQNGETPSSRTKRRHVWRRTSCSPSSGVTQLSSDPACSHTTLAGRMCSLSMLPLTMAIGTTPARIGRSTKGDMSKSPRGPASSSAPEVRALQASACSKYCKWDLFR